MECFVHETDSFLCDKRGPYQNLRSRRARVLATLYTGRSFSVVAAGFNSLRSRYTYLGRALSGSAIACNQYLVQKRDQRFEGREISRKDGEARFSFDQLINPKSVVLAPGGRWGYDVLLNGRVTTISADVEALNLFGRFSKAIKKNFTKVRAYSVGPDAIVLLRSGARLTIASQSPREYDLVAD